MIEISKCNLKKWLKFPNITYKNDDVYNEHLPFQGISMLRFLEKRRLRHDGHHLSQVHKKLGSVAWCFFWEKRQYVEMPNSFLSCVYDIYIYMVCIYIYYLVNIYCILLYITILLHMLLSLEICIYIHISNDYIYITIYVYSCQAFHFGKSPMYHGTKVRSRSSRSGWGETMGGMLTSKTTKDNDQRWQVLLLMVQDSS